MSTHKANKTSDQNNQTNYVVEQILKDFLTYLQGVRERFSNDGSDWEHGWDAPTHSSSNNNLIHNHNNKFREWTPMEADKHKERLKFFGRALGEQMKRLPRESKIVRNILEQMKVAIREGMKGQGRQHVAILIQNTSKLLHIVQPVDLEKLIQLLKINRRAGDSMDNKDVVLLLGSVGAGKTTTLHFLAGTSFAEVEVDGFFHLQPTGFLDPAVMGYKTGCGQEGVTRTIQTAQVTVDGKDLVLCDTPGFGENEAVEEDIANGLGIVRALHRANTVRPVLLLSREGMGDRFKAFSETLSSVTRLIGNSDTVDLGPFNYVFTKYEKRHRACMCRQFILIRKRPRAEEEGKVMFQSLVGDIIQKTTPEAKIALPMEEGPLTLLRKVLQDDSIVTDPKKYFIPFVSDSALRKLKLQLQITLRDIMSALAEEDYGLAIYRMTQLNNLALVLPEAGECAQLAMEASLRHIALCRDRVTQLVEHAQEVKIHKQFTQLVQALVQEIGKVLAAEDLRCVCFKFEKQSFASKKRVPGENEPFCIEQVKKLAEFISRDIPDFDPKFLNIEALMKKRGSFLTAVVRLKEMGEILYDVPAHQNIADMYKKAFKQFYTFVEVVLSEAEQKFHTSPKDVQSFERRAWFLAVLIQGFLNKPNSGTGEHESMEGLENRRLGLMMRLEIKITDTLELVNNTRFPGDNKEAFNPASTDESDSLPLIKLAGLRGPREILVSVSKLPRLCKFLPSGIDISEIKDAVSVLDKKIMSFLDSTVIKAEALLAGLALKKGEDSLESPMNDALSLRDDLKMVVEEFTGVRRWSAEIEEETKDSWGRILIVQNTVESGIASFEERLLEKQSEQDLGFSCGVLPTKYMMCIKPKSNF